MRLIAAVVASLAFASTARAQSWQLAELPSPPPGWSVSPRAINASGQIAGEYRLEGDWSERAFFFDGKTWRDVPTLGGAFSWASGLNDRGDVVGGSETGIAGQCWPGWDGTEYCEREIHAFLFRDGVVVDLGAKGSTSVATGINDAGLITGTAGSFAQRWMPGGTLDVFGTFGGTCLFSSAHAINARGAVVGYASTDTGSHTFIWDPRMGLRDLGTLGGPTSWATAISNTGHVVGESETGELIGCATNEWGTWCEYKRRPFLWKDGRMINLGGLGELAGPYGAARAVNSSGEVAGAGDSAEKLRCWTEGGLERCMYRTHAFVWADGRMIDLGEAGRTSFATGINDRGDIVGVAESAPWVFRPVIWRRQ